MLAPTGTIGFMMDCDTTGIEPDIALVKYKKLVGGGMLKIVNQTVPAALEQLGYSAGAGRRTIIEYIDEKETIEGAPHLKAEHLPVFDCAFKPAKRQALHPLHGPRPDDGRGAAVPLRRHLQDGQHARRRHVGGHRAGLHRRPGSSGLKAIAVYRDGCKRTQPLNTSKDDKAAATAAGGGRAPRPVPRAASCRTSATSITHKFSIAGHEGYITVGMYEDGTPGEIFIAMAKEGSTISGLMDTFAHLDLAGAAVRRAAARCWSTSSATCASSPSGFTKNPDIPYRQVDHRLHLPVAGLKFLSSEQAQAVGVQGNEHKAAVEPAPAR